MKTESNMFWTDGDVETAILYETKNSFTSIINKDLYTVRSGEQVFFENHACLELFCIRVFEFLNEKKITLKDGQTLNLSVFSGGEWFVKRHSNNFDLTNLENQIQKLTLWLDKTSDIVIWTGSKEISFQLSRRQQIRCAGLLSKHSLIGLNNLVTYLHKNAQGEKIHIRDIVEGLETFQPEIIDRRIVYLATELIETLFDYFTEMNKAISKVYGPSSNHMTEQQCPKDSSDWFWTMHWWTLIFSEAYNRNLFQTLKPKTPDFLKRRF